MKNTETALYNRMVYWILFLALVVCGVIKLIQTQWNIDHRDFVDVAEKELRNFPHALAKRLEIQYTI